MLAVVLVGVGVVAYQGLTSASLYFYNADEAVEQRDDLGDKRIRVQGAVQDDVDAADGRRHLHGRVQRRRGAGRARRRPARAVRARHPGGARGPLGRRRSTLFHSDEILVKHDEQYEADNGDRIEDAEDGQTGDASAP